MPVRTADTATELPDHPAGAGPGAPAPGLPGPDQRAPATASPVRLVVAMVQLPGLLAALVVSWARCARPAMASLAGAVRLRVPPVDDRWWEPAGVRTVRRLAAWRARRRAAPITVAPRRTRRWGEALAAGLCAFALWLLFDAPTLLHSAEAGPLGARRTVAVATLRPIAAVSRDLGLSHVVGAADRALGRSGHGVVPVVRLPGHARARHLPPPAAAAAGAATDALAPLPVPSPASPLRVLAVGDSLGVDFGGPFADALAATGVVAATMDARVDTGLARPDYFDWPAELQADLERYHPQVVVVFLGANDPQNFVEGGTALAYGTAAWSVAYGRRVGALMQEATAAGARVLWVGMPPMADPALTARMQVLNALAGAQAAGRPGVTYVPSWPVLSDAQGAFAQYLPDASGAQVQVREPDGTHISAGGGARLAQAVIAAMDRVYGLALRP